MRLLLTLALATHFILAAWWSVAAANGTIADYHGDPARTGHYIVPGLTWTAAATAQRDQAFDGTVVGNVYAQPLYWLPPGAAHGMVIVATESNVVQALDAQTGRTVWKRTIGAVVPRSDLPCGGINPSGITGTPVIDDKAGALYLDATVLMSGIPQHLVFGLSLANGGILPGWPVNVADSLARQGLSFTPRNQDQRGALALISGRLYVPFGGNGGDRLAYHGWVVGVSVASQSVFGVWVTRADKGGIWAQAPLSYVGGSLFVATGNTKMTTRWSDGEAIERLPLTLRHSTDTHDYFAPADWLALDQTDTDLGGTGPLPISVPLAGGGAASWLLALGKDGNAYVLDRANLGGIGGQLLVQPVANGPIITGPVTYSAPGAAMVAFGGRGSACPGRSGITALAVLRITAGSAPSLATAWCAALAGKVSPIVTTSDTTANLVVWIVGGEGDQRLHGYRGDTGQVLFAGGDSADLMAKVRRFTTILAAEGRLYVAGSNKLFAFGFKLSP